MKSDFLEKADVLQLWKLNYLHSGRDRERPLRCWKRDDKLQRQREIYKWIEWEGLKGNSLLRSDNKIKV